MDESLNPRVKQLVAIIGLVVVIGCVYVLVSTVITAKTTGIVHVQPSIAQASISVSQSGTQAKVVGTGETSVRLKPGVYQVAASAGTNSAIKTVRVSKTQTADVTLKLSEVSRVRSVDDVNFNGISGFINSGLSESQVDSLRLDFFRFKPSVKTIDIDTDSLQPAPRNRLVDTSFKTNFDVTVDSVPYKATIVYSGYEDISLFLYNTGDGSLAFSSDSGSGPLQKAE